jgi:hypothetical protein
MSLKHKAIFLAIILSLGFGLVRYCDRDRVTPTEPGKLSPGEKERVEIKGRTVIHITADKTTRTFVPDRANVSIGKDGRVTLNVKRFGLTREPGLGASWNGDKLKLTLDVKFMYYRRLGLHVGSAYDPTSKKLKEIVRPLAFVSYTVPHDSFVNTSLWVGAELFPRKYAAGIRLAF